MERLLLIIVIVVGVFFGTLAFMNRPTTNPYGLFQPTPTPTGSGQGDSLQQEGQIQSDSQIKLPNGQQIPVSAIPTAPQTTGIPYPIPESLWVTTASQAAIKTAKGDIVIQLYAQDAPKTVTNFATWAKLGYYNNLTFHRVEDWVIQGGDPKGNGTGGMSIYGPTFADELIPGTASYQEGYKAGVVAMANRGPDTNGSQFFILKTDYPLEHNYTIFGKVISGMDVVQKIAAGDKILGISITTQ